MSQDINQAIETKIDEAKQEIIKTVDETVAKFIKNLPHMLKGRMEAATARMIGMEDRYGGSWEVDHCNGRQSLVSNYINDQIKQNLGALVGQIGGSFKLTEDQENAIKRDYERSMISRIRREVLDQIDKHAKTLVAEITEPMFEKLKINLSIDSMADPNYGATELEKLALEQKAKELSEKG